MRSPGCTTPRRPPGAQPLARLAGPEPPGGQSPAGVVLDVGAAPGDLGGIAGDDERSALGVVAGDVLLGGDPTELVDGVAQRGTEVAGAASPILVRDPVERDGVEGRDPAAVAAARAEADVLRLEDAHVEQRVAAAAGSTPSRVRCSRRRRWRRRRRRRRRRRPPGPGGCALPPQRPAAPAASGRSRGSEVRWTPRRARQRSRCSMSSNSAGPMVSGGASWTTGSPRSSARQ